MKNFIKSLMKFSEEINHLNLACLIFLTAFISILFVVKDPLNILQQNVTIRIEATGDKNNSSKAAEVWITAFGKQLDELPLSRGWVNSGSSIVCIKDYPSTLIWNGVINRNFEITFQKHSFSGKVNVYVNNKVSTYDLYNQNSDKVTIHPIEMTNFIHSSVKLKLRIIAVGLIVSLLVFILLFVISAIIYKVVGTKERKANLSQNTSYLGRLDHLRFLAASLVILYHFFHEYINTDYQTRNLLVGFVNQGHTGVGLFMILSGFIFGIIGYNKRVDYFRFLFNRIVRIYPLYIAAVFIVLSAHRTDFATSDIITFILPFINPAKLTSLPLFGQLWTIGVEFQFYLIFPFINMQANKKGKKYLFMLLLLSLFFKEFYYINSGFVRDISYWTILGRLDEFLIGMIFSRIYKENKSLFASPFHLVTSSFIITLVMLWFNIKGGYFKAPFAHFWVIWPSIEGFAWAYFSISYISSSIKLTEWIERGLAILGAMSFSFYIMHYTVIPIFVSKVGLIPVIESNLANVIITGIVLIIPAICILSFFTYTLIEKPFFDFKKKYIFELDSRKDY